MTLFVEAKKETGGDRAVKGPVPADRMAPEDRQLLDDSVARDLWEWLAERFPDARLAPGTNLGAELGIDSMAWLNLTLDIRETVGVDLTEEAIGRIETVRDLLREATAAHGVQTDTQDLYQKLRRPEELLSEEQQRWLTPPSLNNSRNDQTIHHIYVCAFANVLTKLVHILILGIGNRYQAALDN